MILRKCAATHTRLGHMDKNRIACGGEEHILHRSHAIRSYSDRSGNQRPPIRSFLGCALLSHGLHQLAHLLGIA